MKTESCRRSLPLAIFVFSCCLLVGAAYPAQACMGCSGTLYCFEYNGDIYCFCDAAAAAPTVVNVLSASHVQIVIQGYKTTNLQPSNSCVTAISPVEGISRVNSVTNYDGRTSHAFEAVSFSPSDVAGPEIARIAKEHDELEVSAEPWTGFLSNITGTVPENTPNYFVVDVTVQDGVTVEQLVDSLRTQGVFATSSSDRAGFLNPGGHRFFKRLGDGDILVRYGHDLSRERLIK